MATDNNGRLLTINHPAILIGIMGDHIAISSAVCIAGQVYTEERFSQRLRLDFHADKHVARLTDPPPKDSLAHLFSSPTPVDDEPLPTLAFKYRMSWLSSRYIICKNPNDVRSGLYIASMPRSVCKTSPLTKHSISRMARRDGLNDEIEVIVKFTSRYNPEAYQLLADVGLASTLHLCRRVHGDLYVVVMDYLEAPTLWAYNDDKKTIPYTIYEDVEGAVKIVHEKSFVFGDLRALNIMVVPKTESEGRGAMLVDFDLAGVDGEDRYGATMNDELDDWAPGMQRGQVMRKEHDLGC